MNYVKLQGNIVKEPDFRMLGAKGTPKCVNTVAVSEEYNGKKNTTYIPVEAWGERAEELSLYAKGSAITLIGKLVTGSYEKKDGSKAYTWGVNINKIEVEERKKEFVKELLKDAKVVANDDDLPF